MFTFLNHNIISSICLAQLKYFKSQIRAFQNFICFKYGADYLSTDEFFDF